jgi:hypothetical protein
VIDRHGYPDNGAAIEQEVSAVLHQPPLVSSDGRYSFYDLTAYADAERERLGDAATVALAQQVLGSGPIDTSSPVTSKP